MSAQPIDREDFDALLQEAKEAFSTDPEYLVDLSNSAQRVLRKRQRRQERKDEAESLRLVRNDPDQD